jgi:hypothetical protein
MVRRKRRSKNHLYSPLKKVEPNPFCEALTVVPLHFSNRMFCSTFSKSGKVEKVEKLYNIIVYERLLYFI